MSVLCHLWHSVCSYDDAANILWLPSLFLPFAAFILFPGKRETVRSQEHLQPTVTQAIVVQRNSCRISSTMATKSEEKVWVPDGHDSSRQGSSLRSEEENRGEKGLLSSFPLYSLPFSFFLFCTLKKNVLGTASIHL